MDADATILAHAQQNPLYAAILIENYRTFMEASRMSRLAILICLSQFAELQTDGTGSIHIAHLLFGAIFAFEKATDCTDIRHMDCIYLKTVLDALKEGGFYQSYLKFTLGMQISTQMHTLYAKQRGGAHTSLMYFVIIMLSILANMGAIQINSANKYARQIIKDYTVYNTAYDMKAEDPQAYFNLYFSKIASYYNQFGSCVYQSLTLGASSDSIKQIYKHLYDKHSTKYDHFPVFAESVLRSQQFIHLFKVSLADTRDAANIIRNHAQRIYTILNDTYHNASISKIDIEYFEPLQNHINVKNYLAPRQPLLFNTNTHDNLDYIEKRKNFVPARAIAEISAIKHKLHLHELTGDNIFKTGATDHLIITLPAIITGHALNILYNTKNNKIGIYDYNGYSIFTQKNNINFKHGLFYNTSSTDDTITDKDAFKIETSLYAAPLYVLEPGFWDNTNFDVEINAVKNNSRIPIETLIEYTDNPINAYFGQVLTNHPNFNKKYATMEIGTLHTLDNSYFKESDIPTAANIFQGWGCMTANNCAESAITFLETYADLINRNKQFYEIGAADMLNKYNLTLTDLNMTSNIARPIFSNLTNTIMDARNVAAEQKTELEAYNKINNPAPEPNLPSKPVAGWFQSWFRPRAAQTGGRYPTSKGKTRRWRRNHRRKIHKSKRYRRQRSAIN